MAQLLESLRNQILTTLFGRRLGLDVNGFLIGQPGVRDPIEDFSTTAAASAAGYGVTRALASGSSQVSQYTMQRIPVGGLKTFTSGSTSTAGQQFSAPSGVTILTASVASTVAWVTLLGLGATVSLQAMSSLVYQVLAPAGPLVAYTTST